MISRGCSFGLIFATWLCTAHCYQPLATAPWNSTWLQDLTPRASLENTIAGSREVWVVAILHNESAECQDRAVALLNLSKALSGIARVGFVMCDTSCVEGCCKSDSLGERLGSTLYPSLHAVFPWAADKQSRPISGHEELSTVLVDVGKAGANEWKPRAIATWLGDKVPYGGKILKSGSEMQHFYDTPLIPKLLLVSGKKGVPLMFKLLSWQFGDTVDLGACGAGRPFVAEFVKEVGQKDFKAPALFFSSPDENGKLTTIRYDGMIKRQEIATFIKTVMPMQGTLVGSQAGFDSYLLKGAHLPKLLWVTTQRRVPYLARRLAWHMHDQLGFGVTRWTKDSKKWIKARLALKSEKQLPALLWFPRKGEPVGYTEGWDFTSIMKFMRKGIHNDSLIEAAAEEVEEAESSRRLIEEAKPAAEELVDENMAKADEPEMDDDLKPAGWMDWFSAPDSSGDASAESDDPSAESDINATTDGPTANVTDEPAGEPTADEQTFMQLAELPDAQLWDEKTRQGWRSNLHRGIVKRDWDMNRADLHELQDLQLLDNICRTSPGFHDIDLDGNGRVNKREYLLHAAAMKSMPAELVTQLEHQHGFKIGEHVRWIGKFEPTWREGKAALVKEFGRNVEGKVFVLVHSEGDVGPNETDTSFGGGYIGRRVKIEDVEASNAQGDDQSLQVEQSELSATAVFEMLHRKVKWSDGDDEFLWVLHQADLNHLNLASLLPQKDREGMVSREKFISLFHRYLFQQELFHAISSLRSDKETANADNGHATSCMGRKYCLTPRDIKNFKLSLKDIAASSAEFRRFGRLTMEKKIGFSNTKALLQAMIARRSRRLAAEGIDSTHSIKPIPRLTTMEKLQYIANAGGYFSNEKAQHELDYTKENSDGMHRMFAGRLSDVKVYHQVSAALLQPRNPVLVFPDSTSIQLLIFPAAEALAWIRFLGQMSALDAQSKGATYLQQVGFDTGNLTLQSSEVILRAQISHMVDFKNDESGDGYLAVSRCEESGILRVFVKAKMLPNPK